MCYNYSADFPALGRNPIAGRYFSLEDQQPLLEELVDGFQYAKVAALCAVDGKDDYQNTAMEWGFIPPYIRTREDAARMRNGYKDPSGWVAGKQMLNAKGEEMLLPRKIFRAAAQSRRCLVPASGFYEYHHYFPMGKRGVRLKTPESIPYYVTLPDAPQFFFAGVWTPWVDQQTGEMVDTVAIVTTDANELMAKIHNSKKRMPVILPSDLAEEWMMSKDIPETRITALASHQYESDAMSGYTIAKDFKRSSTPKAAVIYPELSDAPHQDPSTLF
jgi:putative SOS response-associated peptidase YedK